MKKEKCFKISAYVLGIAVFLTACISLAVSASVFFAHTKAPAVINTVMTVLNVLIPLVSISLMIVFINYKQKCVNSNKN